MSRSCELDKLIQNLKSVNENCEIEFKESSNALSNAFWETYSSFANTSGGFIILGVSENKTHKVIGVNNPEKIKRDLFNTANNKGKVSHNVLKDENVHEHKIDGVTIISVYIRELSSNQKPLYLNGIISNAYIRKNEGDYKVTMDELRRFIRNSENDLDSELLDNYLLEDLNPDSVLSFKSIMHKRKPNCQYLTMDDLKFLTAMGIFRIDIEDNRKPKLTLAGLLFLGKLDAIIQRIPHFHMDYINRRGVAVNRWRDRVSTGDSDYPNLNLFEFYQIVRQKLRITVEDKFELDEKSIRKPSSELDTALREALTNMIVHADYFDSETSLQVIVDNLYYTFLNPGKMKITQAEFFTGGNSVPRNNTLIQYFRLMGESERAGTGGREIIEIISKNKYRAPELITDFASTKLKLWCAAPADSYEDLSEHARLVLRFIDKKVNVTRNEIKKHTGLSDYYTYNAITELLNKNLINSYGKGRATRYQWSPSIIETFDMVNKMTDTIRKMPYGN